MSMLTNLKHGSASIGGRPTIYALNVPVLELRLDVDETDEEDREDEAVAVRDDEDPRDDVPEDEAVVAALDVVCEVEGLVVLVDADVEVRGGLDEPPYAHPDPNGILGP